MRHKNHQKWLKMIKHGPKWSKCGDICPIMVHENPDEFCKAFCEHHYNINTKIRKKLLFSSQLAFVTIPSTWLYWLTDGLINIKIVNVGVKMTTQLRVSWSTLFENIWCHFHTVNQVLLHKTLKKMHWFSGNNHLMFVAIYSICKI